MKIIPCLVGASVLAGQSQAVLLMSESQSVFNLDGQLSST